MRLLYWTELYWPHIGGVEVLGRRFVAAMAAEGHDVAVVTGLGSVELAEEDEVDGVPVHRFPFDAALAGRDVAAITAIRRRLTALKVDLRPDLVHVQLTDPSVFFHLHTLGAEPPPMLVSLRVAADLPSAGEGTLFGSVLSSAAWITANSHAVLDDVRRLDPSITPRSSVIYNGIDPTSPATPLPEGPPLLAFVGRLVEQKGADIAIRALAGLVDSHPGVRLAIAGDGPERASLERLARELDIDDRVDLVGWVEPSKIDELLRTASVVVVPSRWREAFSLVALEGALAARPVVATATGGIPEVVVDGSTGILVAVDDHVAMTEAIDGLLSDRSRATAMGIAARRRAEAELSFGRFIDGYARLFRQLVPDGGAHPA